MRISRSLLRERLLKQHPKEIYRRLMLETVSINNITKLHLEFPASRPGTVGARNFVREKVPFFRFHNPRVEILHEVVKDRTLGEATLTAYFKNGGKKEVPLLYKSENEVFDIVLKLDRDAAQDNSTTEEPQISEDQSQ